MPASILPQPHQYLLVTEVNKLSKSDENDASPLRIHPRAGPADTLGMHFEAGMRDSATRKRAAAWALGLWLLAAAGLGIVRSVAGSTPWSVGAERAWAAPLEVGLERGGADDGPRERPVKKSRQHGSKQHGSRRHGSRPATAGRAKRQRLALAVGHSLPVPVEKAPGYKLDNRHHDYPALDLLVKHGTPVRAVTSGRVRDITKAGACGRGVIVRGKDGLTYTYCHGNKVLVRKGQRVPAGETIMKSGNTGNSSAPHLHLQVASQRGRLLCPQHMLSKWQQGKDLPGWKVGRRRCVR